jgi:hypothetical protein
MATFIWPPEVQWPPPAHITANYDVVAPDGVQLLPNRAGKPEEVMTQPYLALITPLTGGHPDQGLPGGGGSPGVPTPPIYHPGHPDHGLPAYPDQGLPGGGHGGRPDHGFNPDYPDQGLPGRPGRPPAPGQGLPGGGRPVDPGFGWGGGERPGHPIAPGGGRPVDPGWGVGEERPGQGLPPELGPPVGPVHPWVPAEGETLPPPPEEIADQVVVAVWRPGNQAWSVAVGEGPSPAPHGR